MKRVASLLAILVLSLAVLIPATTIYAENSSSNEQDSNASESQQKKEAEKKKEERTQQIKDKIQANIDAAKEARIKAKCKAAQGILNGVVTSAENIKTNRTAIYERLTTKVNDLLPSVQAAGIDTAKLEADMATLQSLIGDAQTNFEIYIDSLKSSVDNSCQENPDSFYELLETARTARSELKGSIDKVREFVTGTLKKDLQDIKLQLESSNSQSNEEQTTEQNTTSQ